LLPRPTINSNRRTGAQLPSSQLPGRPRLATSAAAAQPQGGAASFHAFLFPRPPQPSPDAAAVVPPGLFSSTPPATAPQPQELLPPLPVVTHSLPLKACQLMHVCLWPIACPHVYWGFEYLLCSKRAN
jgi:hypothetical protein